MTAKKSNKLTVPPQGGMVSDVVQRFKLILRLLGDKRVSPWVKLIPVGALIYLISPIDLIMGIPGVDALDDAAVLWFGSSLFVELCPPDVVEEHTRALASNLSTGNDNDDVIDSEATDVNDNTN